MLFGCSTWSTFPCCEAPLEAPECDPLRFDGRPQGGRAALEHDGELVRIESAERGEEVRNAPPSGRLGDGPVTLEAGPTRCNLRPEHRGRLRERADAESARVASVHVCSPHVHGRNGRSSQRTNRHHWMTERNAIARRIPLHLR